ncbi:MAG: hypothetical protein J3K34DRAFT_46730 [Monoraphidium minutum]|nr:MAG: hypothetical protein J3K34DRAFT_46730 [Monoraphidium minutum]
MHAPSPTHRIVPHAMRRRFRPRSFPPWRAAAGRLLPPHPCPPPPPRGVAAPPIGGPLSLRLPPPTASRRPGPAALTPLPVCAGPRPRNFLPSRHPLSGPPPPPARPPGRRRAQPLAGCCVTRPKSEPLKGRCLGLLHRFHPCPCPLNPTSVEAGGENQAACRRTHRDASCVRARPAATPRRVGRRLWAGTHPARLIYQLCPPEYTWADVAPRAWLC